MATLIPDARSIPDAKKVGMVSLGCPKALVDSERILTRLRADGYAMSADYAGADVVLVNTCGFLDSAKEESLAAIGEAIAENGRVIVTGCMGNEAEVIRARFPQVLAVTGAHQYEAVVEAVHEAAPPSQGPVGLSATQLAVEMGARVIAVDVVSERRQLARQFGADAVIDPASDDPVKTIRGLTHGEGAHKTLDASSAPEARAAAVRAVRAWGTACFVGERGQVTLDVSPDLLRRQVTLVGSWTFSKQGQAECAEFIADRKVDVERLFTHRWTLDQADEAYRLFDTQTTGKGVILPS